MLHPTTPSILSTILQTIQTNPQLPIPRAPERERQPLGQMHPVTVHHTITGAAIARAHFEKEHWVVARLGRHVQGPRDDGRERVRLVLRPPGGEIVKVQKCHVVADGERRVGAGGPGFGLRAVEGELGGYFADGLHERVVDVPSEAGFAAGDFALIRGGVFLLLVYAMSLEQGGRWKGARVVYYRGDHGAGVHGRVEWVAPGHTLSHLSKAGGASTGCSS
jgi:hypothetical protein